MALDVLVSPGCADVSDEYLDRALGPSDVLIDVGEIFRAVTRSDAIPNTRPEALRLASALQITAIRFARENNLNGIVRTGNAARPNIDKLQTASGGGVKVLQLDRETACQRIRALVRSDARAAACEAGLTRFFDRYHPLPTDEVVR